MPGLLGTAQPSPQLTTPACSQVPLTLQTRGPPESPWGGEGSAVALKVETWGWRTWAHLAGILSYVSRTHHVFADNLDVVSRGQAGVVVCVTNAVFYNGDLHLLQGERWWEMHCGAGGEHAASAGRRSLPSAGFGTPSPMGTLEPGHGCYWSQLPRALQLSLTLTSHTHITPACHPAHGPRGEGLRGGGQSDRPDMAGAVHRVLELQQGDVCPVLSCVVVGVGNDPADG